MFFHLLWYRAVIKLRRGFALAIVLLDVLLKRGNYQVFTCWMLFLLSTICIGIRNLLEKTHAAQTLSATSLALRCRGVFVEVHIIPSGYVGYKPTHCTWCTILKSPLVYTDWSICVYLILGSGKVTKLSLPLYLEYEEGEGIGREQEHQPYRQLSITITLQLPCITIHPPQLLLTPVPLESNATAKFTLLASGYRRWVYVHTQTQCFLFTPGQNLVQ